MSRRILYLFAFLLIQPTYAQNAVSSDDLAKLTGDWTETLTYVDYSTNKRFTKPANVRVQFEKKLAIN